MLEKEIVERISRLPFAGVISDENRLDGQYIVSLMESARAQIAKEVYQKNNKRLNPVFYQKYYPTYSEQLQEAKTYVKFSCPEVLTLDSNSDGLRYIGTTDCSVAFRRIWSRSMLSTINKHQVMSVKGNRYTAALYDGSAQMMEIYGNAEIEEIMIEALFANPHDIPTWNADYDPYPFPDDLLPLMDDYIFRSITSIAASAQPETRNQYNQTTQRRR